MDSSLKDQNDAKKVFRECGTCSKTFAYLLDREFGEQHPAEEQALDLLAGGIMNSGHQCGMLWGAALAAGAEAYRRHPDLEEAVAVSVTAAQHIVESFEKTNNTVNCREITGVKLDSVLGMVQFMARTMLAGMDNSQCFNMAERWAPEAVESAQKGLEDEVVELTHSPVSCASLTAEKMGASDEEQAMVSGFAGGLGLSGHGCGALSAAIWMKTLAWCREHPGKRPPYFNYTPAKKILKEFKEAAGDELNCRQITGQIFTDINDHSAYIRDGGCAGLIERLAHS